MVAKQETLTRTFVELADTLVADFDVVDFLTMLSMRCVELFAAGEAGVMLADRDGELHVAGSSSHGMRQLELLELQHDEGPCPDSFHQGVAVSCPDLETALERWPRFAGAAVAAGFGAADAVPLRLRGQVIGALNLLRESKGPMDSEDITVIQALADVATIGILQQRTAEDSRVLSDQLKHALTSRVVIEQAKGFISQSLEVDMERAFALLRHHARSNHQRLADVAAAVVAQEILPSQLR